MSAPVLVPVYSGGQVYDFALVDAADVELLSSYRWLRLGIHAGAGARLDWTAPPLKGMLMHRYILGLTRGDGKFVHHVNEDSFDNRRENLQVFDSAMEANCQPHPRRDSQRRHKLPPHYREMLIDGRIAAA